MPTELWRRVSLAYGCWRDAERFWCRILEGSGGPEGPPQRLPKSCPVSSWRCLQERIRVKMSPHGARLGYPRSGVYGDD